MAGATDRLGALKNRTMMLVIGGALVLLLIWFVAYFSPSGKQLGTINSQAQAAETQQSQLNLQLARLKAYSKQAGALVQLSDRLGSALPATTDIYNYITELSNAGSATGIKILSVSPGSAAASGKISVASVGLTTSGTYDQTLAFIKALYALPRLTIITSLDISGGGSNTSRSSTLQCTLQLDIFALPSATTTATAGG